MTSLVVMFLISTYLAKCKHSDSACCVRYWLAFGKDGNPITVCACLLYRGIGSVVRGAKCFIITMQRYLASSAPTFALTYWILDMHPMPSFVSKYERNAPFECQCEHCKHTWKKHEKTATLGTERGHIKWFDGWLSSFEQVRMRSVLGSG